MLTNTLRTWGMYGEPIGNLMWTYWEQQKKENNNPDPPQKGQKKAPLCAC
jgi:hypothetical protein